MKSEIDYCFANYPSEERNWQRNLRVIREDNFFDVFVAAFLCIFMMLENIINLILWDYKLCFIAFGQKSKKWKEKQKLAVETIEKMRNKINETNKWSMFDEMNKMNKVIGCINFYCHKTCFAWRFFFFFAGSLFPRFYCFIPFQRQKRLRKVMNLIRRKKGEIKNCYEVEESFSVFFSHSFPRIFQLKRMIYCLIHWNYWNRQTNQHDTLSKMVKQFFRSCKVRHPFDD